MLSVLIRFFSDSKIKWAAIIFLSYALITKIPHKESPHETDVDELSETRSLLRKAIADGELFLENAPDDVESMLVLGGLYGHSSKPDMQLHWAQKALKIAPERVEAWILLGTALGTMEHWRSAEHAFNTALSFERGNNTATYSLGVLAMHQGKIDAAADLFSQVLESNPNHADSKFNIYLLKKTAGMDQSAKGRVDLISTQQ